MLQAASMQRIGQRDVWIMQPSLCQKYDLPDMTRTVVQAQPPATLDGIGQSHPYFFSVKLVARAVYLQ